MVNIKKIIKPFLATKNSDDSYSVSLIKNGYNREVYLLKVGAEKFVIKVGIENGDIGVIKMNDVMALTFLESVGCDFVPRIVYSNKKNSVFIETYVGKEDIAFDYLTRDQLDAFARQLVCIHGVGAKEYLDFLKNNHLGVLRVETVTNKLETYGFGRFEIVKKLCSDRYVVNWIEDNLNTNLAIVKNISEEKKLHLNWGDIGDNLRQDESGRLFFIDWEFSGLGFGSEMAYIKIHSHLGKPKFKYLVDRYLYHSGLSELEIRNDINLFERITRVNDVVWAAMKWSQASSLVDKQKYRQLTYKRIDLVKNI